MDCRPKWAHPLIKASYFFIKSTITHPDTSSDSLLARKTTYDRRSVDASKIRCNQLNSLMFIDSSDDWPITLRLTSDLPTKFSPNIAETTGLKHRVFCCQQPWFWAIYQERLCCWSEIGYHAVAADALNWLMPIDYSVQPKNALTLGLVIFCGCPRRGKVFILGNSNRSL